MQRPVLCASRHLLYLIGFPVNLVEHPPGGLGNDAFPGSTVVEKGLNRTYENLRAANESFGVTLLLGSDSFSFVTPWLCLHR